MTDRFTPSDKFYISEFGALFEFVRALGVHQSLGTVVRGWNWRGIA